MEKALTFVILQSRYLYKIILVQNRSCLLWALVVLLAGGVVGCFGYEHFRTEGAIVADAYFIPPADLSTLEYLANNARIALIMMFGGILTLGALAAGLLFINGVIIGESAVAALERMPAGEVLMRLLPHGLFEVPALLLAGAGGFMSLRVVAALLRDKKGNYQSELLTVGCLATTVVLLLAVAAAVEAHITPALVSRVYGAIE